MKNLNKIIISVFTLVIVSQNYSYSHGECKTRNSCNWNTTGWQYWAKARVANWGIWTTDHVGGCAPGFYSAYKSNSCAWQEAVNNYGSHYENGAVVSNYLTCSRGNANNQLYYNLHNFNENLEEKFFEKGTYKTGRVKFNKHDVLMDSINITLQAKGTNLFSSFEIAMWLPENVLDSIHTLENRFLYGKITLMNGKVNTEGIFNNVDYRIVENSEGIYELKVENFIAHGVLPEGLTNDNTLIEVVTSSDAGIDEKATVNEALVSSNNDLIVYPNPAIDFIEITLTKQITNHKCSKPDVLHNQKFIIYYLSIT